MSRPLPTCVTFWAGPELGAVERACMKSVLRQGHELAVYCYEPLRRVPAGVEVRDAGEILPQEQMFVQAGSVAGFSDWFRCELLDRGLGTWVDTDIYLVRPIEQPTDTLLAEEEPGVINNAVLCLPPSSPILRALLAAFRERKTPKWLPWHLYLRYRFAELVRGQLDLSKLPWGTLGPLAITSLARKFKVSGQAAASEVFHPVNWRDAAWLLRPDLTLEQVTTEATRGVHLWNECIKAFKNEPAPKGSFLDRLQREGAS